MNEAEGSVLKSRSLALIVCTYSLISPLLQDGWNQHWICQTSPKGGLLTYFSKYFSCNQFVYVTLFYPQQSLAGEHTTPLLASEGDNETLNHIIGAHVQNARPRQPTSTPRLPGIAREVMGHRYLIRKFWNL